MPCWTVKDSGRKVSGAAVAERRARAPAKSDAAWLGSHAADATISSAVPGRLSLALQRESAYLFLFQNDVFPKTGIRFAEILLGTADPSVSETTRPIA
jgi:hypothetical protein